MTIEDDLRDALHARAETIEPSADGLDRIEARLSATADSRIRLAPRLLAAAALLLVVGAVGAFALRGGGSDDIAALPSSSTTVATGPSAIESELVTLGDDDDAASSTGVSDGAASEAAPQDFGLPAAPPGVLGPRAATPAAAINEFLGLIQRGEEDIAYELDGSLARVTRIADNGEEVDVTVVQLGSVEMDDGSLGVVVVQALSPQVLIQSPSPLSTISDPTLTVSGEGTGFEAQVDVELYSSNDGVWLNRRYADAGNFGVVAPFTTELPLSGSGPAWVVVQSFTGADTSLAPFSAVPVVLDAPRAGPDHLVTNIAADDSDGGLVVRTLPGTDGTELGILPPGLSGIRKRAALSVFVGDGEPNYSDPASLDGEEWWSVWLPEPLENGRDWGWVNSRYLTIDAPVSTADAEAIGTQFIAGLRGDDAAFATLPWSSRGVTFGLSSDLKVTTAGKAALPEFWRDPFSFMPPPAFTGTLDGSLREIFSPTRQQLGPDTAVDVALKPILEASPYSNVNEELASQFAGSTVVQLTDPSNDGSGWRLVNLYVQQGSAGPEIVAMVSIEWTP